MLEVSDLIVSYGKLDAVRSVSLEVRLGEATVILGANGAGKSSTLRAIAGLHRPRAGQVHFRGDVVTGYPAHRLVRRGLVMVPEGRRVFASLSVEENLKVGAHVRSKAELRRLLARVNELFPVLNERSSSPAGLLSGGEQQMLAFGRALMADPVLVLLDEPSMGLAPIVVDTVFQSVKAICDTGVGVLMVEQNADAAIEIAAEVIVMAGGRIAFRGDQEKARSTESVVHVLLGEKALE